MPRLPTACPKPRRRPKAKPKPIARTGRIKRRRRTADEFRRIYGSEARVLWIAAQPCVGCGGGPCEGHHVTIGGAGKKADAKWIVPLCASCHRQWHDTGEITAPHPHYPYTRTLLRQGLRYAAQYTEAMWRAHLRDGECERGVSPVAPTNTVSKSLRQAFRGAKA